MLPLDAAPLAYVGPETALPVASALAAIAGVCLTFGRFLRMVAARSWKCLTRCGRRRCAENPPSVEAS